MKIIPLTQGMVARVDDADYERINTHKWFARKHRNTWYAVRTPWPEGGSVLMHREILGTPKGIGTDHWDGDGLNNQRYNLRVADAVRNGQSFRRLRATKLIPFRGVTAKREKFRARITVNKVELSLGSFESPFQAALAYDVAATLYFGEFAHLNFPA